MPSDWRWLAASHLRNSAGDRNGRISFIPAMNHRYFLDGGSTARGDEAGGFPGHSIVRAVRNESRNDSGGWSRPRRSGVQKASKTDANKDQAGTEEHQRIGFGRGVKPNICSVGARQ